MNVLLERYDEFSSSTGLVLPTATGHAHSLPQFVAGTDVLQVVVVAAGEAAGSSGRCPSCRVRAAPAAAHPQGVPQQQQQQQQPWAPQHVGRRPCLPQQTTPASCLLTCAVRISILLWFVPRPAAQVRAVPFVPPLPSRVSSGGQSRAFVTLGWLPRTDPSSSGLRRG